MGCAQSREEGKILRILDALIYAIARDGGSEDAQFERKIVESLQNIQDICRKKSKLHPRVQHQFIYAMGMLKQRRPVLIIRLSQHISDTQNLIAEKTPLAPAVFPGKDHAERYFRLVGDGVNGKGIPRSPKAAAKRPSNSSTHSPVKSATESPCKIKPTINDAVLLDAMKDKLPPERTPANSSESIDGPSLAECKLKSFYASGSNQSLETLGDFGFFDEENLYAATEQET